MEIDNIKNKKIVVTGGLGFIGSHLVEELHTDNDVFIVDNESTGKHENIQDLDIDNISLILGSITRIDLDEIFEGADFVLHQAALPSVPRSVKDPLSSNEANITGTLRVLIAARDCDVKKVVAASSSSVYGDTPVLPKVETMPLNPQSPYATTKATGELYCQNFIDIYGLSTVCLRYFNVFGPRQDPKSQYSAVIPKFITAILYGKSPVIFGDGEQSRDFTYVKNVVQANILACETNMQGVYNVACGRRTTLNELADIIGEIVDLDVNPEYTDPRPGDVKHSLADIEKIKKHGYEPSKDFKEDLKKVVDHFLEAKC
ncbi:SDR family oxidoreductase [Methanobacterium petrolearium]|uniref:SDR family oxidoreductase n=1 Tax=Methanobacterium petrolearium TaxID=710190 RepID=UPI001AE3BC80|nr:SDR family oxidoreductase [Methanobacterium petrolearium]MBP1945441.1 UDP-glucose 4-epimerase [Methanobacterium petrolearium]BDZ71640.1 UDP-glucose 4-epimerase-like protein [Methanobacterium petrolearium]